MKSTVSKPRARVIRESDVEEIARLVGTRFLNEKEACSMLGLNSKQWFTWKCRSRNSEVFENLTRSLKSSKINLLINRIEDASDPTKVKRADWRAASWLGERLKPESLSLQAAHSSLPVPASTLDTSRLIDAMTRVYAVQPVAVIECRTTQNESRTTGEQAAPVTGYASTPPPRRR